MIPNICHRPWRKCLLHLLIYRVQIACQGVLFLAGLILVPTRSKLLFHFQKNCYSVLEITLHATGIASLVNCLILCQCTKVCAAVAQFDTHQFELLINCSSFSKHKLLRFFLLNNHLMVAILFGQYLKFYNHTILNWALGLYNN